tara:strand:- start:1160 stop:2257 length:1098 start_codon:yes stop_codon:yes gene_type:complete
MSDNQGLLILEDGSSYRGDLIGSMNSAAGEVVFVTAMTGYQEVLTDPSYAGQIVVFTYPLIGNYGINEQLSESVHVQAAGCVIRNYSTENTHRQSKSSLDVYMAEQDLIGITGIDTRAITRKLRSLGVMKGVIVKTDLQEGLIHLRESPEYGSINYVSRVSAGKEYEWDHKPESTKNTLRIVVHDCGLKFNILRILKNRGCEIIVVPNSYSTAEILNLKPDGVIISPGPGDPSLLSESVESVRQIALKVPTLGICLGHQLIARAFGAQTFKMKFGHRGANHPVKDLRSGKVYITAQNHGYAVDRISFPEDLLITHVNLNDDTVEGIRHRELPVMSIQYHSEASPGPRDNEYIFDEFLALIRKEEI